MTQNTPHDRLALRQCVDDYLAALVLRDPGAIALAPSFRLTENGQEVQPGDGLWATASGLGRYRHYVLDTASGQAGLVGVIVENGKPVILALRLKVAERRPPGAETALAEAEMIVAREDILFYRGGTEALEAMGGPAPVWSEPLAPAERCSRQEMLEIAAAYFSALEGNDGTRTAPFAPGCRRLDNGVYATQNPAFDPPGAAPFYALGPAEQLRLGYFVFVTEIRERRCPVVDEDLGVIFSLPLLDHAGTVHEAHLTDGRSVPIRVTQPFSWQAAELFQIRRRQIAQIEVVLNKVPYRMRSHWG